MAHVLQPIVEFIHKDRGSFIVFCVMVLLVGYGALGALGLYKL